MKNNLIFIVAASTLLAGLAACKPSEPAQQTSSTAAKSSAQDDCATRRA